MKYPDDIIARLDKIIELGRKTITSKRYVNRQLQKYADSDEKFQVSEMFIDVECFYEFKSSGMSFIERVVGKEKYFYEGFNSAMSYKSKPTQDSVAKGIGVLKALREDLINGGLLNLRQIVAADIFTDFFDRIDYFFESKHTEVAAILTGSLLEQHLKMLCKLRKCLDVENKRANASAMNDKLHEAEAYNQTDYLQLKAWIDIRNKAAHGRHNEYSIEQVSQMIGWAKDFIERVKQ